MTTLHDLADRLARLAPSHRDPHKFYEEKSEIVAELRAIANSSVRRADNDNYQRLNKNTA